MSDTLPITVEQETIAAVSTAPGRGGIGIVRVCGPGVPDIARRVIGSLPPPRRAVHSRFRDAGGTVIDDGLALYFPAPSSYSGDETLELHGHGGPVVLDMVLRAVVESGARKALPGEFSQRAFLNERLDLAQAEAVADLIGAASENAARGAMRSLQGQFSDRVEALVEALVDLRVRVEATIDFPDDEVDHLADPAIATRLEALNGELGRTLRAATSGWRVTEGISVVLVGAPNVGKSSLLNRLAGRERAIVTAVPGTTRDLVTEQVVLDGLPTVLTDTAGLRASGDEVERIGVERARAEATAADVVLVVVDDRDGLGDEDRGLVASLDSSTRVVVVRNKVDLSGGVAGAGPDGTPPSVRVCAIDGAGVGALVDQLKRIVGATAGGSDGFSARRRHVDALQACAERLGAAGAALRSHRAAEIVAEELRLAHVELGVITGAFSTDELLERIFSTFCIGK